MGKQKKCQARNCKMIIATIETFCGYHWSLLPTDEQNTMAKDYQTPNWNRAIGRARSIIRNEENNLE